MRIKLKQAIGSTNLSSNSSKSFVGIVPKSKHIAKLDNFYINTYHKNNYNIPTKDFNIVFITYNGPPNII